MVSANGQRYILLPLAVVIFFFNVHPCLSLDQPTQQNIEKICREMEDFNFCSRTFTQNIKTPSADFVQLTQIALDQTTKIAEGTHDFIVQLLAKVTDEPTKNALIACENGYHVVMEAFQEAFEAFNRKDYDSMLKSEEIAPRAQSSCVLKSEEIAPRAQSSCEVSFLTPPSQGDPLKENNRRTRILIAMAVVAGNNLLGH